MAIDDRKIDELIESNIALSKSLGSANRPGGGIFGNLAGLNAAETDSRQKFTGGVNTLTDVFAKLASGTATTADGFTAIDSLLSKLGGNIGGVFGHAIKELGDGIIAVNNTMKITGQYGVTLGGDLGDYARSVLDSHLSLTEFSDIVGKSSVSMAGLSTSMDKSAKAFLGIAAGVVSSDIGRELQLAGMSARELAEITQISMMNKKGVDLQDLNSKKAAMASAIALAEELDRVAQLTGRSRKEQEDMLRRQQENAEVMAEADLQGEEFAASLEKSSLFLGETGSRLLTELSTGRGLRTTEGIELAATYKNVMPEFRAHAAALKSHNQALIESTRRDLDIKLMDQMNNAEFKRLVANQGNSYLKLGDMYKDLAGPARQVAEYQRRTGASTAQALDALDKQIELTRQRKTPEGEAAPGAITSQAINSIDYLGKVAGGVAAHGFKELNDKLGETAKSSIPAFQQALDKFATPSKAIETGKKWGEDLANTFSKGKGWTTEEPANVKSREVGTLGATGKLTEKFPKEGELIKVHNTEAILTEDQLRNVVNIAREYTDSNGDKMVEDIENGTTMVADSPLGKELLRQQRSMAARLEEAQRVLGTGIMADGKFQNVYNSKAVEQAQKTLDQITNPNGMLKNLGVSGFGGAIQTPKSSIDTANSAIDKLLGIDKLQQTNDVYKKEDAEQQKAKAEAPTIAQQQEAPALPATSSINDLIVEVNKLNTSLKELISHTDDGVDKQVRAIKSLSGNRLS